MPDLIEAGGSGNSESGHSDVPMSPKVVNEGGTMEGEGRMLTLEEIGKRRHQEWLENRQADAW